MKNVIQIGSKRKPKVTHPEMAPTSTLNSRVELIEALIPIGRSAVAEELKRELAQLAGIKHSRQGDCLGITAGGVNRDRFISLTRSGGLEFPGVRDVIRNRGAPLES